MATAGDIAIVGYGADAGVKSFSFVLLADLGGQTISFTDNGWKAAGGFRTGEGTVTYTVPAGAAIGTVITISGLTGTLNPSTSGDQILAYVGDAASPTFLFGVDFADGNATWAADATSSNTSAVPTGLDAGSTALAFGADNGAYTGPTAGTRAEILANIANAANWTLNETTGVAYPAGFTVNGGGDSAGSFAVANSTGLEGAGFLDFTVTRSGGSTGAATLDYAVAAGSADAADFAGGTLPAGQVSFADGETSKIIRIALADDAVSEPSETFTLTISQASAGTIGRATATGTILNDDFALLEIGAIQGAGHRSGYVGQSVATSGIVTAVAANGFYVQDPDGDGNSATSDGIFVFTGQTPTVRAGDGVTVSGTVSEYAGSATALSLTQISAPTVTVSSQGNALPEAVIIGQGGLTPPSRVFEDDGFTSFDPATDGLDFYESLEGMRVTIDAPIAVSETNIYGETWVVASGGAGATGMNARGGITISQGDFNPERIQIDADATLFGGYTGGHSQGDRLEDVTGIMSYSFNSYEMLVTEAVTVVEDVSLNRDPSTLRGDADHVSIASFNMENLDPNDGAAKFSMLAQEIVYALNAPDIIGAQEIQDANGAGSGGSLSGTITAQTLIDAITAAGGPTYRYVEVAPSTPNSTGGEPNGNIRNGYFYNADRVTYVEGSATLVPGAAYAGSRSPLAADFQFNGQTFTALNVHFTSRGGSQPLEGVNQPPANAGDADRTAQATDLRNYVNAALATDPTSQFVLLGDFNGFYFEPALQTLQADGLFTNLNSLQSVEERYTYVFEGNAQALDNILVTGGLLPAARFDVVHYNAEQNAATGRATDHDQPLALIRIAAANQEPVAHDDAVSVDEDASTGNLWATLLGNDTDGNAGDVLSITSIGRDGTLGTVTFDVENATLVYTADAEVFDALEPEETATDHFTYTISDGHGGTSTATVTMTINGLADLGETLIGTNGANVLTGTGFDDVIRGRGGNDRISGGRGSDRLFGDAGADIIDGGAGQDWIDGGTGNDVLTGDAGADSFAFGLMSGRDTITDFDAMLDEIVLQAGVDLLRSRVMDTNGDGRLDVQLTLSGGNLVNLLNVSSLEGLSIEHAPLETANTPLFA